MKCARVEMCVMCCGGIIVIYMTCLERARIDCCKIVIITNSKNRVLVEKPVVFQLFSEFSAFCRT
jgi:hypothetical protein